MAQHKVCLIRGDGIGPEITQAVLTVLEAAKVDIEWVDLEAGLACVERGLPIVPEESIQKLAELGVGLKAPLTTPIGKGSVSPNVTLRKRLDLYACVRPVRSLRGLPTLFPGTDLVIFRENTEDVYGQVEYMATPTVAYTLKIITEGGCERICRAAFEYARANGRRRVTAVHKANIMKIADGLFLRTFQRVAAEYPDIEANDRIVDAQCMHLVTRWTEYDVLVTENLYGDILSDLCAGMVGGLGVAPGANMGTKCALFEAVHGSAPDIAGQNRANPTALLLSATQMLAHLGEHRAKADIEGALEATLERGVKTTDLGGDATTSAFAEAIASELRA
ncbi:MAG: isocitrate/isopropylmalate family dehydrogenase [Fimbriimonadales bacterium]|nr:isocitrate/isopropylmalate family dehydrogenase [Fimbriimonadales bacterium]